MVTYSLNAGLFTYDEEGGFAGDPVAALDSLAAAGFRETELIAEGEEWETPGSHDTTRLKAALNRTGIFPHTLHTPFQNVDLASSDEKTRRSGVALVAAGIRFLAELGGRTAIVHPTGRSPSGEIIYTLESMGAAMENAHRSIAELVKVSEETGVRMALENLPARSMPCRPLETMQELRAFIADLPAEHVGICMDTGHTRLVGLDIAEQARIASERLYALHIQDGDGPEDCHLIPGHGVLDWDSFGAALSDIGFDGAWTFEVLTRFSDATAEQMAAECASLRERWVAQGMSNPVD